MGAQTAVGEWLALTLPSKRFAASAVSAPVAPLLVLWEALKGIEAVPHARWGDRARKVVDHVALANAKFKVEILLTK